jgi:hypothetical protein
VQVAIIEQEPAKSQPMNSASHSERSSRRTGPTTRSNRTFYRPATAGEHAVLQSYTVTGLRGRALRDEPGDSVPSVPH